MGKLLNLLAVISLIGCLGQIGSDIYTPSLPAIADSLDTSINSVQMSMAVYLFGLAFSQLIYGPLSEGIGRRIPLLLGLFISLIGCILAIFATSIQMLILARFVQGAGVGACAALWRSIFRDLFTKEEISKYASYMSIVITFVVPAAPVLGGYLQEHFGWQANFVFLAFYTLAAFLVTAFMLHETSQHHHSERLRKEFIVGTFKQLLSCKTFMGFSLAVFVSYGAFFAWFVVGPVLVIDVLQFSPVEFGWITFICGGSAIGLAGLVNGRLAPLYGIMTMLRVGWSITIFAGILMLGLYYVYSINIYALVIPVIIFYFGISMIWPNAFAGAFANVAEIAGYAGAVYGFILMAGGATMGSLMSKLPDQNQLPLALVMTISPIISWLLLRAFVGKSLDETN